MVKNKGITRCFAFVLIVLTLTVSMGATVFAAVEGESAITTEMLEPILDGLKANIGIILPIGIGIFAIVLGIRFIPRIFKMFTKG